MNITTREQQILEACKNYDNAEAQRSDNMSNCDLDDAARICGGKHEAAGVISSLVTKGLVTHPSVDEDGLFFLTDKGIEIAFQVRS